MGDVFAKKVFSPPYDVGSMQSFANMIALPWNALQDLSDCFKLIFANSNVCDIPLGSRDIPFMDEVLESSLFECKNNFFDFILIVRLGGRSFECPLRYSVGEGGENDGKSQLSWIPEAIHPEIDLPLESANSTQDSRPLVALLNLLLKTD